MSLGIQVHVHESPLLSAREPDSRGLLQRGCESLQVGYGARSGVKDLQSLRSGLSEFFDRGPSVVTTVLRASGRNQHDVGAWPTCEFDETPIDLEIELAAAAGDDRTPWWPYARGLTT